MNHLNFAHCFRPIYFISRVFGLMPFSIVYYPNGDIHKPKVTIYDVLWLVFSLVAYGYGISVMLSYMNGDKETFASDSRILNGGYAMSYSLGLVLGSLSVILDMSNRFSLIDIVKKFDIFDKEVSGITLTFSSIIAVKT